MSGCKHPLTNFALLLVLFLLYSVYPIPFITIENFEISEDFLLIDTCGATAILITGLVGNLLCLLVFIKIKNAAKYLFILMVISDMIQGFFYLPGKLKQNWQSFRQTKYDEGEEQRMTLTREDDLLIYYYSVRHGLVVFSIVCFSLICVLDFYAAVNKIKKDKIAMTIKGPTVLITIKFSVFLGWLYYVNIRQDWRKVIALSVLSYFIPIVVCTICLFLSSIIRNCISPSIFARLPQHQPSYKFIWKLWLAYVLFYTPWFAWSCHRQQGNNGMSHAMNTLLLMKPCSNIFLLIEYDAYHKNKLKTLICGAYEAVIEVMRSKCCSCLKVTEFVATSRDKLKDKLALSNNNSFVVVETANGIYLENGGMPSRNKSSTV